MHGGEVTYAAHKIYKLGSISAAAWLRVMGGKAEKAFFGLCAEKLWSLLVFLSWNFEKMLLHQALFEVVV